LPRVTAEASAQMAGLLKFPPAFREAAFMECMDCFAAMIADPEVAFGHYALKNAAA
jgi:hypothetical protein